MLHARRDFDAIQPWPTKRPHFARQDGAVVEVPTDPGSAADVETQIATGRLQPIIPDDEPVFLIRGQDPIGAIMTRLYARAAAAQGAAPDLVDACLRHADLMDAWAEAHPHGVADAPDGVLR